MTKYAGFLLCVFQSHKKLLVKNRVPNFNKLCADYEVTPIY